MPPDLCGEMVWTFIEGFPWSTRKVLRKVASLLFQGSLIPKCHLKNCQRLIFRNSLLFCTQNSMLPERKKKKIVLLLHPRFIVLQISRIFCGKLNGYQVQRCCVDSLLGERRKDSSRLLSHRGNSRVQKGPGGSEAVRLGFES